MIRDKITDSFLENIRHTFHYTSRVHRKISDIFWIKLDICLENIYVLYICQIIRHIIRQTRFANLSRRIGSIGI